MSIIFIFASISSAAAMDSDNAAAQDMQTADDISADDNQAYDDKDATAAEKAAGDTTAKTASAEDKISKNAGDTTENQITEDSKQSGDMTDNNGTNAKAIKKQAKQTSVNTYSQLLNNITYYNKNGGNNSVTINLGSGNYKVTGAVRLNSTTKIQSLTINGNGQVIDGQNKSGFLYANGDSTNLSVTLKNLVIQNCNSQWTNGGAVSLTGITLSLTNVTFINNTAANGGALYIKNCPNSTLSKLKFADNKATNGGAIYIIQDALGISDSTFISNYASSKGGAICNMHANDTVNTGFLVTTYLTLDNITFINTTSAAGGAIYKSMGELDLMNCNFINSSAKYGGIIKLTGKTADNKYETESFHASLINNTFINAAAVKCNEIINITDTHYVYIINNTFTNTDSNLILSSKNITQTVSNNNSLYANQNVYETAYNKTSNSLKIKLNLSKYSNSYSNTINGTLTIYDDKLQVCTYNNYKPQTTATISLNNLTTGEHNIRISFTSESSNIINLSAISKNSIANSNKVKSITAIEPIKGIKNNKTTLKAYVVDVIGNNVNDGNVTFILNNKTLGTAQVTDGVAKLNSTLSKKDNNTKLTAKYNGCDKYLSSSDSTTITTLKIAYVNLLSTPLTQKVGEKIMLVANVVDDNNNLISEGYVTFKLNGETLKYNSTASYVKVADGVAIYNYVIPKNYTVKTYAITATYEGDDYVTATDKGTLTVTSAIAINTQVMKSTSYNTTFKVTVKLFDSYANGTIKVYDNGKAVSTNTLKNGIATVNLVPKTVANKTYKICYLNDQSNMTKTIKITKSATKISVNALKSNAINTTLKITVKSYGNLVSSGTVQVLNKSGKVMASGTVSNGAARIQISPNATGKQQYTVKYLGNSLCYGSQWTGNLTVIKAGTNLNVQVLKSNAANTTFKVTVRTGNILVKSGTVQVLNKSGKVMASGTVSNGAARIQISPNATGKQQYTVKYVGNSLYSQNQWKSNLTIVKAGTNLNVEILKSNTVNTTFKVTVRTGNMPVKSGTVKILNKQGKVVATAKVVNGVARIQISPNATGKQQYTVKYAGNSLYSQNQWKSTLTIYKAGTNIALKTLTSKTYKTSIKVTVKTGKTLVAKGTVQLIYKNKVVAKATIKNGVATLTTKLSKGTRYLTVKYITNSIYNYSSKQTTVKVTS